MSFSHNYFTQYSTLQVQMTGFPFLRLNYHQYLFIHSSIHLSIHPSIVDTSVASISMSWLLWIILQQIWAYLFKLMFLFPSEKYPEVELLNHMIVLFLSFIFLFISYWSTVDLQCCVSGVQQSDPIIHVHMSVLSILFQIFFTL